MPVIVRLGLVWVVGCGHVGPLHQVEHIMLVDDANVLGVDLRLVPDRSSADHDPSASTAIVRSQLKPATVTGADPVERNQAVARAGWRQSEMGTPVT